MFRIFNVIPIKLNLISRGYAGNGQGKNNFKMENIPNVGPLPIGFYDMLTPIDSPEHGPFSIPLSPDPKNQMYGREGFFAHGDSVEAPGCASKGCIILQRIVRELLWQSGDHQLQVIH